MYQCILSIPENPWTFIFSSINSDTLYISSLSAASIKYWSVLLNYLQCLLATHISQLFLSAFWIISYKISSSLLIVSPAFTNLLLHFLNFVFHFDFASFIEVLFFISAKTALLQFSVLNSTQASLQLIQTARISILKVIP